MLESMKKEVFFLLLYRPVSAPPPPPKKDKASEQKVGSKSCSNPQGFIYYLRHPQLHIGTNTAPDRHQHYTREAKHHTKITRTSKQSQASVPHLNSSTRPNAR